MRKNPTNILRGIIGAVTELPPPANVDDLKKRVASATERATAAEIIRDWNQLSQWRGAWDFPHKRHEVALAFFNVKSVDELDRETARFVGHAVFEGREREIDRFGGYFRERFAKVSDRLKPLLVELNTKLIPHIEAEISNCTAHLKPIFEKYGCDPANSEPAQRLVAAAEGARTASRGEFSVIGHTPESLLREWI